jgi:CheY-like chemotaxis protein
MANHAEHGLMQQPIVLVVDDDAAVRTLLGRVVASEGCKPLLATCGTDGYGYLAELGRSVTLLLLDVTMPGMDAFAFRELQLDAPRVATIPTVVITGRCLTLDEVTRLQPTAVLTKPISLVTLRNVIRSCVGIGTIHEVHTGGTAHAA